MESALGMLQMRLLTDPAPSELDRRDLSKRKYTILLLDFIGRFALKIVIRVKNTLHYKPGTNRILLKLNQS